MTKIKLCVVFRIINIELNCFDAHLEYVFQYFMMFSGSMFMIEGKGEAKSSVRQMWKLKYQ
jgi:hypothetical protein